MNGYGNHHSPDSSQLSGSNLGGDLETTLISRTQKQHTTQQVTTTTKTVREVQYLGPDGTPLSYIPQQAAGNNGNGYRIGGNSTYEPVNTYSSPPSNSSHTYGSGGGDYESHRFNGSGDPPRPHSSLHHSSLHLNDGSGEEIPADYPHRPPTPPSPSDKSNSPPPQYREPDYLRSQNNSGSYYPPRSGYDELDTTLMPPSTLQQYSSNGGVTGVHWRDPDLHEVIEFLSNPNSVIKANAAAYLQHLCYMDDPVKAKTRQLGGIPPLVALLANDVPEIYRNSCGALRNLSYGRQNDENKRAIKNANGIVNLVRLLRKTPDDEVKELVTGVLWNLSSCDDLKRNIIDEALSVLVNVVIIPHSGWSPAMQHAETSWTTVFRNTSGILRNVSSAGDYGRKKLREIEGLVDSLLYLVRNAIEKANIDNKSVENGVCVLRNLSYRAQEIEDPNYDKKQFNNMLTENRAGAKPTSDNLGCFGASKHKRKDSPATTSSSSSTSSRGRSSGGGGGPVKGMDLLWQPEVVQPYLNLLSNCSNPETLEAAAGAIQNLSACYWQPSIDVRAAVRKEKGLPILVELLRMEVDRVVCAVATALRNLAIDQRNKELIGKYAMRDLVQKLPGGNAQHDHGTSDDTIAAVLATLNEVIKKHPEFSRSLLEAGGVDRLMNITRQRQRYTPRVVKFASQVLYSMWVHQELRDVYRKAGWKEQDFVTKTVAARNARPNSPTNLNSTLNRPMASQSGTRYEDRTIQRGGARSVTGPSGVSSSSNNVVAYNPEEVPMENLSLYGSQRTHQMYAGGNHLGGFGGGEPVYAQVNRDRKKNRSDSLVGHPLSSLNNHHHVHHHHNLDYSNHSDHWHMGNASQQQQRGLILDRGNISSTTVIPPGQSSNSVAGDSWV
ncbi:catenin delta-2 isoform X2 [Lepeophtheirus salmonis]|uniref:catenin delta-2 isoform X2 n=1 Tax=Lepeophtheirus salmonis TaxID=72036 RepID=UPI001AE76919|nr:catenin delta-2-like isoform X3 [Lepeophtheirus salmonis]